MIEQLTNLNVEVHEGGHSYLMLPYGNSSWKLDATVYDLTRVKLGLSTAGFVNYNVDHEKILKDIDKELNYSRKELSYYYDQIKDTSFLDIVLSISKLLEESSCKYYYSDASQFYTHFASIYNRSVDTYVGDGYEFNKLIALIDDLNYFRMYKEDGEYKLKQIEKEEYKELKRTLKH